MRVDEHEGSYRWVVVAMLWLVCLANYADRQAIFSLFPPIQTAFHLSKVELGVVGTAFMWTYAVCGPLAGWLVDRFSRKATIVAALVFWSIATAATAIVPSYTALLVVRALGGLGEAFYFPAAMSLIADYHGQETRSRAMSVHQSSVYVGSVAGGALSAWIGQHYGWRVPFPWFGGFGLLLAILLLLGLREIPRGGNRETLPVVPRMAEGENGLLALLKNGPAVAVAGIFVGANFVALIFLSWTPTYLYERFHLTLSMAGFSGTAYLQVASILGVLLGGVLADRLVRRRRGGRMLAQSLGLAAGVPFLFLTGWVHALGAVMIAIVGFGLAKGVYDANIWASLYDVVPLHQRGTAVGVMNSLGWIGGGVATVGIAYAAERYGFAVCLSATSVIYLLLALGMYGLSRRVSRDASTQVQATSKHV